MTTLTLFMYAMGVFCLMLTGLALTILEFKYGAPKKQEEAAKLSYVNHSENVRDFSQALESRQIDVKRQLRNS